MSESVLRKTGGNPAQSRYCDTSSRWSQTQRADVHPFDGDARIPEEALMSQSALPATAVTPTPLSLRQIAPWALFSLLLAVVVLYFVGAEQGAFALLSGDSVHEWVHDGRHLLGFPCH